MGVGLRCQLGRLLTLLGKLVNLGWIHGGSGVRETVGGMLREVGRAFICFETVLEPLEWAKARCGGQKQRTARATTNALLLSRHWPRLHSVPDPPFTRRDTCP
jgi:hypothetical protein